MARNSGQASSNLPGLILAVLAEEPLHGYGIARQIELLSANALSFGEGTLYPALRNLEQDGFILGAWDTTGDRGPARKVYKITPSGRSELNRLRQAWYEYTRTVEIVLKGNLAQQGD